MRKYILSVLASLLFVSGYGQTVYPPTGSPNGLNRFKGGLIVDSMFNLPVKDTIGWFGNKSDLVRESVSNKLFYLDENGVYKMMSAYDSLYIDVSLSDLTGLISGNGLIAGKTYKINGVDVPLYGGTTIFLRAVTSNTLEESGIGMFYNPKYNKSVAGFGIAVDYNWWYGSTGGAIAKKSSGVYSSGDTVIWGGMYWECVSPTTTSTEYILNDFDLDPTYFSVIPYNKVIYDVVYDETKADFKTGQIIARNERNNNIVECSYTTINQFGINAIKAFQWGNVFDGSVGVGNQLIRNSLNVNINFRGSYQNSLTFDNSSQDNLSFDNSSQDNLSFSNSSQNYLTFDNSSQNNLSFSNSSQYSLTFDNSSQYSLTFDNSSQNNLSFSNSSQYSLTFDNSSQNSLTFDNSSQDNLSFDNSSQDNLSFSNSSQNYLTFDNSYQSNLTFDNNSYQNSLSFSNVQLNYQSNLYSSKIFQNIFANALSLTGFSQIDPIIQSNRTINGSKHIMDNLNGNTLIGGKITVGTLPNYIGTPTTVLTDSAGLVQRTPISSLTGGYVKFTDTLATIATKSNIAGQLKFTDTLTTLATKSNLLNHLKFTDTLTTIGTKYDLTKKVGNQNVSIGLTPSAPTIKNIVNIYKWQDQDTTWTRDPNTFYPVVKNPTLITDLVVNNIYDTAFTLNFTPVAGATSYKVYVWDTLIGTITASGQALTNLKSATIYKSIGIRPVKSGLEIAYSNKVTEETYGYLTTANESSLSLAINANAGGNVRVIWETGVVEDIAQNTTVTHIYPSAYTGKILFKILGGVASDIFKIQSQASKMDFNISILSQFPNLTDVFFGGNATITGNISIFAGKPMTRVYFNGTGIVLTGDLKHLRNVSSTLRITGGTSLLTYTTATWGNTAGINLALATGRLTTTEVDQLFIDVNAGATSGSGTIDLRGNNAAPTSASAAARASLVSKGRTILTN